MPLYRTHKVFIKIPAAKPRISNPNPEPQYFIGYVSSRFLAQHPPAVRHIDVPHRPSIEALTYEVPINLTATQFYAIAGHNDLQRITRWEWPI